MSDTRPQSSTSIVGWLRATAIVRDRDVAYKYREAAAEIERLRAALQDALIGINHIALYKADNWPAPDTDPMEALEQIGAGQSYDLWCCWNAGMRARKALEGK